MASQKGTRSMSWLQIPKKVQKLHNDSLLGITIDYEKYMCADASAVLHMIRQMGFCGELDTDNSNQETCHDQSMTLVHSKNKYGWTYSVHANLPGFASYEMFQFCQYSESQSTIFRSEGGIDFRGAFFKFKEIMAEQSPEIVHFYDRVRRMSEFKGVSDKTESKSLFRRNRIDIAIDVTLPVDQKWEYEYIRPSANSKRIPHHHQFNHEKGGWQSFSYIPKSVSRGIGIRIYNKVHDIVDKTKQSWYPNIDTEKDTVTRIELVYYSPYAENNDDDIIESATSAILGTGQHKLTYVK